jgi:hypothetical protein
MGKSKELYMEDQQKAEACKAACKCKKKDKTIYKELYSINTMWTDAKTDETTLIGSDEGGIEFVLTLSTIELLRWINTKDLKKYAIKYIKQL